MPQKQHLSEFITQRVADTATASSAVGFSITLADINEVVSIGAGVAAIISASMAAYYYYKQAKKNGE